MSAPPVGCSDCGCWYSTSGSPVCGICRVSRAVHSLPADPRLNSENYDLVHSILERSLGEVNGWLSVPLGAPLGSARRYRQLSRKRLPLLVINLQVQAKIAKAKGPAVIKIGETIAEKLGDSLQLPSGNAR